MAPKKSTPAKATGSSDGFTPERFERELQGLATKAQEENWRKGPVGQASIYLQAAVMLGLLGLAASVSQLSLSPVYGSIPSEKNHRPVLMAGCFVGWAGNLFLRNSIPLSSAQLLPLIAAITPVVNYFLGGFSEKLGAWWGPLLFEAITLFPLAVATSAYAADTLEGVSLSFLPQFLADATPGIGSWVVFRAAQHYTRSWLPGHIGQFFVLTRVGLQMLLTAVYSILAPSKYLLLAVPALLHAAVLNTHVMTPMATTALNATLNADGWVLLDRQESLTGYVSVVESQEKGFRVMRCDHSLLGGEWVRIQGKPASEPVYGVFVMLEAVRLIEREVPVPDSDANALVIGLGIGTTPSAFVDHGINTKVVEIDPVVVDFARKYFNLRENSPAAVADAVSYTADLVAQEQTYDYIVHDVFTGGAEPIDLFTLEFLQGLSDLLKPDGVIAINYAGDFSLPTPRMIIKTIKQVFPTCRIFRESERNEEHVDQYGSDFTNMVIFCRKTTDAISFRRPTEPDYLRSHSRRVFLHPKHEVPEQDILGGEDVEQTGLLMRNTTGKVAEWHQKSAAGHWKIMRTVLPANVWERW